MVQERRRWTAFVTACLIFINEIAVAPGIILDAHAVDQVFFVANKALQELGLARVRPSNVNMLCSVQTGQEPPRLAQLTDEDCRHLFRFGKEFLARIVSGLNFQGPNFPMVKVRSGTTYYKCYADTIVLIWLRRSAFPCRWSDLFYLFNMSTSKMSAVYNWFVCYLHEGWGHRLSDLLFWEPYFQAFASHNFNVLQCPLNGVIAYADGTFIETCRPSEEGKAGLNQQDVWNGHHRAHGMNFLSLMLPIGIIVLYGPYEGRRHDSALLAASQALNKLRAVRQRTGQIFCLFGDSAFPRTMHSYTMLKGNLDHDMAVFNAAMCRFRQSVEWGFGKIQQIFTYVKTAKCMHMQIQPVGAYYTAAAIATNLHTIVHGSVTTEFMRTYDMLEEITIEMYLAVDEYPEYEVE